MKPFRPLSTSDQLAQYLREEITSGRLTGTMPGNKHLVQSLGVNSVTTTKAVQQLEHEGLVINQGDRRSRLIAPLDSLPTSSLRIGMLYYDDTNASRHETLLLNKELADAGHTIVAAPKNMAELRMDVKRITKLVKSVDVDAWVIYAGSREILDWFEQQDLPAFALYGRLNQVKLASMGIRKTLATDDLISKLVEYGHERIVLLAREERRSPELGLPEKKFLEQLESCGIQTGPYNIPNWEDTPEGLKEIIDSLFLYTPPTAIIVSDSSLFHAIQIHLAHKGFLAPTHISLFCNDYEDSFKWARPSIAHISWDHRPVIRRIVQWSKNIAQGKQDKRKSLTKATLIEGDTIGPAPKN